MRFAHPYEAHRHAGIPVMGEEWRDSAYADQDMAGVVFQDCAFLNVRLERINFSNCTFVQCRFDDCVFLDCTLVQTQFMDCGGARIAIEGGTLEESVIAQPNLGRLEARLAMRSLTLSEGRIEHLAFKGDGIEQDALTLSGCAFDRLEAPGARWRDGLLTGLDLSACEFDNARFERTSFVRAEGAGTDLSRLEFHNCNLYQGRLAEARLRHGESSIFAESVLTDADLRGAALDGALFANARADGARFDGASLNGAMFPGAALVRASFEGAEAARSVWTEADLREANLSGMRAEFGVFRYARLEGANVDDASLVSAQLHGVEDDLDGADTRGAQKTVEWRAELERDAMKRGGA